jgi:hypothetical protein
LPLIQASALLGGASAIRFFGDSGGTIIVLR